MVLNCKVEEEDGCVWCWIFTWERKWSDCSILTYFFSFFTVGDFVRETYKLEKSPAFGRGLFEEIPNPKHLTETSKDPSCSTNWAILYLLELSLLMISPISTTDKDSVSELLIMIARKTRNSLNSSFNNLEKSDDSGRFQTTITIQYLQFPNSTLTGICLH